MVGLILVYPSSMDTNKRGRSPRLSNAIQFNFNYLQRYWLAHRINITLQQIRSSDTYLYLLQD